MAFLAPALAALPAMMGGAAAAAAPAAAAAAPAIAGGMTAGIGSGLAALPAATAAGLGTAGTLGAASAPAIAGGMTAGLPALGAAAAPAAAAAAPTLASMAVPAASSALTMPTSGGLAGMLGNLTGQAVGSKLGEMFGVMAPGMSTAQAGVPITSVSMPGAGSMLTPPAMMKTPFTIGGIGLDKFGGQAGQMLGQMAGRGLPPGLGGAERPPPAPMIPGQTPTGSAGMVPRQGMGISGLGIQPGQGGPMVGQSAVGSQGPMTLADLLAMRKRQLGI